MSPSPYPPEPTAVVQFIRDGLAQFICCCCRHQEWAGSVNQARRASERHLTALHDMSLREGWGGVSEAPALPTPARA